MFQSFARLKWFILFLVMSCLQAGEPTPDQIPKHFKPYAFLIGGSWVGPFPDGVSFDTQQFEWVYGGKFIRNTHFVTKEGEGTIYEGETIFAWDSVNKRIVYWYWNILGGYSEGTMEWQEDRFISQGEYRGNGKTMETRSALVPVSENEYKAVQYFMKDGVWEEQWATTFQRKK